MAGTKAGLKIGVVAIVLIVASIGAALASPTGSAQAAGATSAALVPGVRSITGGGDHFCGLMGDSGLKCWGFNKAAELGDGTITDRLTPVYVSGLTSGVTDVAAGGWNSCAVTAMGGAKCWGENQVGQVGDGTHTKRLSPVDVSGLSSGVVQISVGYYHVCALMSGGGVKCWGENVRGELGDGTTTNRSTPVDVSGLTSGVTSVVTGLDHSRDDHSCALTTANGVKCWGDNHFGELGDGTTTNRSTPVDVSGLTSGVARIFAGGTATCAVMISGGAKCWGHNDSGQLGDGTTTNRSTPVDVSGLTSGVTSIAMSQSSSGEGIGGSHTCAITDGGAVKCWGDARYAQLGDGISRTIQTTPVTVSGLTSGMVGVAVNFYDGCAISSAGGVKCWGGSEVGDGTSLVRPTPVDISGSFFRPECPTMIANGQTSFTMTDGYAVGSVATFVADPGYALIGSTSLTCEIGTIWSGTPPIAAPLGTPPKVVPGSASTLEGDSGATTLMIPVTLSNLSAQTVTVEYNTLQVSGDRPDQAEPGTDYTPISGTVSFAPGETSKTVAITINGDTLVEPDEYVVVTFHDPTNATMGGYWGLGIGFITNDDHTKVVPGSASTLEGDSGATTLMIPVTLSNLSAQTVTVEYNTLQVSGDRPDQAEPGTDYTPISGTVSFAPGETSKTVAITINGDTLVEPDEYVVVTFHDPTNATMGGYWGLGIGFITNDD